MKRLEQEIRACYCQDIEDDSDELALSMLLDGCFILHRLLKHARRGEIETHARFRKRSRKATRFLDIEFDIRS